MNIKLRGLNSVVSAASTGVLAGLYFKKAEKETTKSKKILYKTLGIISVVATLLSVKSFADKNLLPEDENSDSIEKTEEDLEEFEE